MPLGSVSYEQEANAKGERLIWLAGIRGVGQQTAGILETEVFYRKFQNRREVASYVGMTPTTDRFSTSPTLS
jgi:transposase